MPGKPAAASYGMVPVFFSIIWETTGFVNVSLCISKGKFVVFSNAFRYDTGENDIICIQPEKTGRREEI